MDAAPPSPAPPPAETHAPDGGLRGTALTRWADRYFAAEATPTGVHVVRGVGFVLMVPTLFVLFALVLAAHLSLAPDTSLTWTGIAILVAYAALIVWALVTRRTFMPTVVWLVLLVTTVGVVHVQAGGLSGSLLPMVLIAPCIGFFFLGRNWGIGLGALAIAVVLGLLGLEIVGKAAPTAWPHPTAEYVRAATLIIVCLLGLGASTAGDAILKAKRERLNRARQAAEAANAAKSQFLADMSHALRTPLTGLSGVLELLERRDLAPSDQARLLGQSREAVNALREQIEHLLDSGNGTPLPPLAPVVVEVPDLPAPEPIGPDEATSAVPDAGRSATGPRVLVAEDHPMNREVLRRMLEALGLRADLATCGQEAVNLAANTPYELLLLDIRMPGLDGIDTLAAIRAGAGPNHRTPALAVTANAFPHQQESYRVAGFSAIIVKPFQLADLANAVELYIGHTPRAV